MPASPSYKARRTSSWEKRCESPAPGSSSIVPLSSGFFEGAGRACRRPAPLRAPAARIAGRPRPRARASRWSRKRDATAGSGRRRARPRGCRARRAGASAAATPFAISTNPASRRNRHSSQKRNGMPSVTEWTAVASDATAPTSFAPVELPNQLRHVLVAQTGNRQASHSVDPCEAGECFGELRSQVLAPIAVRRKQKQPATGLRGSAGEVDGIDAATWRRPSAGRRRSRAADVVG